MNPDPLHDVLAFLAKPGVLTYVFWGLLAVSVLIALAVLARDPEQRRPRHVAVWIVRLLVGCMWWQQSLWKVPPNYDGLLYWMKQESEHAAVKLQAQLVGNLVIPHISIFGPLVYAIEVAIGVSLMLGVLTRLGALLGLLMALNLWLGLYSAPGEWPWTYFFLILLQFLFLVDPPGRSLGVDALGHRRVAGWNR
ncbi:MAG TPA: DoxX family membrane protein [Acetobacteraceae bacterium]|nr:DoxX family membrane protein [Acetobacteraceae bacterium]